MHVWDIESGAAHRTTHLVPWEDTVKRGFLLLVAIAALTLQGASFAFAHGPCAETFDRPGASDYGRDHIASHTPHGPADTHHNPGTHSGYSLCLGVHSD